jgi:glucuronate isomerase
MAELTTEQSKYVEDLITKFMANRGLNRSEAVKQLHLFVCKGVCAWYKNRGGTGTGFDPANQKSDLREDIESLMDQLAAECNVTGKELMKWFHVFE